MRHGGARWNSCLKRLLIVLIYRSVDSYSVEVFVNICSSWQHNILVGRLRRSFKRCSFLCQSFDEFHGLELDVVKSYHSFHPYHPSAHLPFCWMWLDELWIIVLATASDTFGFFCGGAFRYHLAWDIIAEGLCSSDLCLEM